VSLHIKNSKYQKFDITQHDIAYVSICCWAISPL